MTLPPTTTLDSKVEDDKKPCLHKFLKYVAVHDDDGVYRNMVFKCQMPPNEFGKYCGATLSGRAVVATRIMYFGEDGIYFVPSGDNVHVIERLERDG